MTIETVVLKGVLLDRIRDNMCAHETVFMKACDDWETIVKHELKIAKARWKTGDYTGIERWSSTLPHPPQHHLKEYERTLAMLTATIVDQIALSPHEWDCYWQDEWDWKLEFRQRTGGIGMRAESLQLSKP